MEESRLFCSLIFVVFAQVSEKKKWSILIKSTFFIKQTSKLNIWIFLIYWYKQRKQNNTKTPSNLNFQIKWKKQHYFEIIFTYFSCLDFYQFFMCSVCNSSNKKKIRGIRKRLRVLYVFVSITRSASFMHTQYTICVKEFQATKSKEKK